MANIDDLEKPFLTGEFRVSYAHVLEPWAGQSGQKAKYSVQCIVPKNEPWLKKMMLHAKDLGEEAFGENFMKLVKANKVRWPFRDGDLEYGEDHENYGGMIFFNANGASEGKTPPALIDQKRRDMRKLTNPERVFYSGVYARAQVKLYHYKGKGGGNGVACFLYAVQYMRPGEKLGGGPSIESVFDEVDTDEDVFAMDAAGPSSDFEQVSDDDDDLKDFL